MSTSTRALKRIQSTLVPPTRGVRAVLSVAAAGTVLVATVACVTHASDSTGGQTTTGRPPVAVTLAAATRSTFTEGVDVVGSLTPKFSADVKSELTGVVSAVYVTDWVWVRKGDPLARLDASEIAASIDALKAAVAQAQVVETRARREHERALQLEEYGLITTQAVDESRTALHAAEAATAAAQAQIRVAEARLQKTFIRSPMDGFVALRKVSVGDRVENMGGSEPMFRIVDNRMLDLTVTVPSARLAAIRIGQRLTFSTDAVTGRTFAGSVMFINPAVDEASRSAKVTASVPNPDNALKGGLFVRGRIAVASRDGVLQVPREALLNWDVARQSAELFVVKDGRAEKRTVKTGTATAGAIEIAEGLADGDRVVTRGAFALRHGDRVTVADGKGA